MPVAAAQYQSALRELAELTDYERHPPATPGAYRTTRVERLLALLGSPHRQAPAIHVGGTKGKGSVCLLAAQLLSRCGNAKRIGVFTSPALDGPRSQIAVNGYPLNRERFVAAHARVAEAARQLAHADAGAGTPTRFEWLTALAFTAFADAGTDLNVVEVGLGGRDDATNLPDLPVAVVGLAPISRDHTAVLGERLADIAAVKAGILRRGVPAAIAPQRRDVADLLAERVAATGAPAIWIGRQIAVEPVPFAAGSSPDHPERFLLTRGMGRARQRLTVRLPLLGAHQATNAALALALADLYCAGRKLPPPSGRRVHAAWRAIRLPCRIELAGRDPWVVVDGAHNEASMWVLTETLRERFGERRWQLVFAVAQDKPVDALWRMLAARTERVFFVPMESPRFAASAELLDRWRGQYPQTPATASASPAAALAEARAAAGKDGLVVVAGSLHLAGAARAALFAPDTLEAFV